MNKLLAGLMMSIISTSTMAGAEEALAAVVLNQVLNEVRDKGRASPGAGSVVAYPVPVYQPQIIVMPTCTPNVPCQAPLLQCDTLPVFDQYGRIISYQKTCR